MNVWKIKLKARKPSTPTIFIAVRACKFFPCELSHDLGKSLLRVTQLTQRPGGAARERVRADRGPDEGDGDPRRGEHLPEGDRGDAPHPPGHHRGAGGSDCSTTTSSVLTPHTPGP